MARRAVIRASDADRDRVADRLRAATAEGRLLAEELEERLEALFAARTYGELDAIVADLPREREQQRARHGPAFWVAVTASAVLVIAVAFAVIAAGVFLVTGVLAVWLFWAALSWWFFGHRRRGGVAQRRGYLPRRFQ